MSGTATVTTGVQWGAQARQDDSGELLATLAQVLDALQGQPGQERTAA